MASIRKLIPAFEKKGLRLQWIDINDIQHLAVEEGQIIYYTNKGPFLQIRTLEDYTIALAEEGFVRTDRGSLVSLDKVTYFDSELGKIYFDEHIQDDSHYATVSRAIMSQLVKILPKERDLAKQPKK